MIIALPNDGKGLLYHVVDLLGQTVHAYRDLDACMKSMIGDQRLFIQDEASGKWRAGRVPYPVTGRMPTSRTRAEDQIIQDCAQWTKVFQQLSEQVVWAHDNNQHKLAEAYASAVAYAHTMLATLNALKNRIEN